MLNELHEEPELEAEEIFWDRTSGEKLDWKKVQAARSEEVQTFNDLKVWDFVPISEAWDVTGKPPIGARWVDVNKGDWDHPYYRSRWVARDFKGNDKSLELFAATPPLDALRLVLSNATTREGPRERVHIPNLRHTTARVVSTVDGAVVGCVPLHHVCSVLNS